MNYNITTYRFEWDEAKDRANQKKYGVSFVLATTVFDDPLHLSIRNTGNAEPRWITVGQAQSLVILVVVHTDRLYRAECEAIRITSARRATKRERSDYEEGI
jgi:uncharacterized DUF497 family protein